MNELIQKLAAIMGFVMAGDKDKAIGGLTECIALAATAKPAKGGGGGGRKAAATSDDPVAECKRQAEKVFSSDILCSDGSKPLGFAVYISAGKALMRLWGIAAIGTIKSGDHKGKLGYMLRSLYNKSDVAEPAAALSMKPWNDASPFVVAEDVTWHDGRECFWVLGVEGIDDGIDWGKVADYRATTDGVKAEGYETKKDSVKAPPPAAPAAAPKSEVPC
jgi:hypothetical protein